MFENMTDREKKLLFVASLLIPIGLVFLGFFWFLSAYDGVNQEYTSLMTALETEQNKADDGFNAELRRQYYNNVSLPPSVVTATNEYQGWLTSKLEEIQFETPRVKPTDAGALQVRMGTPEIGRRKLFNVQAKGNLAQLHQFLVDFYQVDLLHRINSLKIIPQTEGNGAKKVRTGQLSIIMAIETISLAKAVNRENFTEAKRALAQSENEYDLILKRNIFGPANNQPTLEARSATVYVDETATVSLSGKDADEQDLLKFELLESSIEGLELEQSRPTDRRAKLVIPSQPAGKYEFTAKVSDNGFPPKETIEKFYVKFDLRPPPKVVVETPPPPPPPPFKHSTMTRVTGTSLDKDGRWLAWITIRTTDERYRVPVGDTFVVDGEEWRVIAADEDSATFEVGGKTYIGRPNPIERGVLKEVSDVNLGIGD